MVELVLRSEKGKGGLGPPASDGRGRGLDVPSRAESFTSCAAEKDRGDGRVCVPLRVLAKEEDDLEVKWLEGVLARNEGG